MRESDQKDGNVRHFRTGSRIFSADGKWWFSTREGERGPYKAREDAERELNRFISQQVDLNRMVNGPAKANQPLKNDKPADPNVWDAQIDVI